MNTKGAGVFLSLFDFADRGDKGGPSSFAVFPRQSPTRRQPVNVHGRRFYGAIPAPS